MTFVFLKNSKVARVAKAKTEPGAGGGGEGDEVWEQGSVRWGFVHDFDYIYSEKQSHWEPLEDVSREVTWFDLLLKDHSGCYVENRIRDGRWQK